ncbi:MAG: hypothetical protein PVG14_19715 [Anaerolineales bacterium]|jgi:hypothetical protein
MQVDLIKKFQKTRKEGDLKSARSIASKMVLCDSKDPTAWLLLSSVIDEHDRKIYCLERVIQLAPDQRIGDLAHSLISRAQTNLKDVNQQEKFVTTPSPKYIYNASPLFELGGEEDRSNLLISIMSCPYLGMLQDPESHTMIPDKENRCFRSKNSLSMDLSHQSRYCLKKAYINCPIYVYGLDESTQKTLRNIEGDPDPKKRQRSKVLIILFLALIIISILFVLYNSFI